MLLSSGFNNFVRVSVRCGNCTRAESGVRVTRCFTLASKHVKFSVLRLWCDFGSGNGENSFVKVVKELLMLMSFGVVNFVRESVSCRNCTRASVVVVARFLH